MRLKRKIGPFIFGVSIGLIIGVGFFIFKINDLFLKLKDTAAEKITIIEQPVKASDNKTKAEKKPRPVRQKAEPVNADRNAYREADSLIAAENNIPVAKEELLTVRHVKPIFISDNTAVGDSLAADASQEALYIEFWKTPLNSRGYRFTRNKLMLYGLADFNVLIYQVDGVWYLKGHDLVCRLLPGGEFRRMEKVNDPELLARLN